MRHTKTPDENGYYWVYDSVDENWYMVYLDAECDVPCVTVYSSRTPLITIRFYLQDDGTWGEGLGATIWHGPLNCPGGDFGGPILEADEKTHEEAEENHRAIRITHLDFTHCDDGGIGGTVTTTALVSRAEAWGGFKTTECEAMGND